MTIITRNEYEARCSDYVAQLRAEMGTPYATVIYNGADVLAEDEYVEDRS